MKRVLFSAAIVAFVASIANAAESPARAQIHGVFDQWDLNGDGKLDAAELAKGLSGQGCAGDSARGTRESLVRKNIQTTFS